jgi:hypothetical protein
VHQQHLKLAPSTPSWMHLINTNITKLRGKLIVIQLPHTQFHTDMQDFARFHLFFNNWHTCDHINQSKYSTIQFIQTKFSHPTQATSQWYQSTQYNQYHMGGVWLQTFQPISASFDDD